MWSWPSDSPSLPQGLTPSAIVTAAALLEAWKLGRAVDDARSTGVILAARFASLSVDFYAAANQFVWQSTSSARAPRFGVVTRRFVVVTSPRFVFPAPISPSAVAKLGAYASARLRVFSVGEMPPEMRRAVFAFLAVYLDSGASVACLDLDHVAEQLEVCAAGGVVALLLVPASNFDSGAGVPIIIDGTPSVIIAAVGISGHAVYRTLDTQSSDQLVVREARIEFLISSSTLAFSGAGGSLMRRLLPRLAPTIDMLIFEVIDPSPIGVVFALYAKSFEALPMPAKSGGVLSTGNAWMLAALLSGGRGGEDRGVLLLHLGQLRHGDLLVERIWRDLVRRSRCGRDGDDGVVHEALGGVGDGRRDGRVIAHELCAQLQRVAACLVTAPHIRREEEHQQHGAGARVEGANGAKAIARDLLRDDGVGRRRGAWRDDLLLEAGEVVVGGDRGDPWRVVAHVRPDAGAGLARHDRVNGAPVAVDDEVKVGDVVMACVGGGGEAAHVVLEDVAERLALGHGRDRAARLGGEA